MKICLKKNIKLLAFGQICKVKQYDNNQNEVHPLKNMISQECKFKHCITKYLHAKCILKSNTNNKCF